MKEGRKPRVEETLAPLRVVFQDPSFRVRRARSKALREVMATPVVRAMLKNDDWWVNHEYAPTHAARVSGETYSALMVKMATQEQQIKPVWGQQFSAVNQP